jgi:hypothetical protein
VNPAGAGVDDDGRHQDEDQELGHFGKINHKTVANCVTFKV